MCLAAVSLTLLALGPAAAPLGARDSDAWTLYTNLFTSGRVEVQLPERANADAFGRVLGRLHLRGAPEFVVLRPGESAPKGVARLVVGAPADEGPSALARRVGIELPEGGGFSFLGNEFRGADDALVATFEDPSRRGYPVILVFGNDVGALPGFLDEIGEPWRPELCIWSSGLPMLRVPLATDGTPRAEEIEDLRGVWTGASDEALTLTLPGTIVTASAHTPPKLLKSYLLRAARAKAAASRLIPIQPDRPIHLFLHGRADRLVELSGHAGLSVVGPTHDKVHVLFAEDLPDDGGAGLVRALLLSAVGEPAVPWMLDAMAVGTAGEWWGVRLKDWVGYLETGHLVPDLETLLDPSAEDRFSEHVIAPLRGYFFLHLLRNLGINRMRRVWVGLTRFRVTPELERMYTRVIEDARPWGFQLKRSWSRAQRRAKRETFSGLCLIDDAAGRGSSYIDADVEESLRRAVARGADACSVTVFATVDEETPGIGGRVSAVRGSASDLALASALATAKRLDLSTMLVLQPLASPSGTWADGIVLGSEADWRDFFERYLLASVHYGLLSQLMEVDVYCMGAELRWASRTVVDDAMDPRNEEIRALRSSLWRSTITFMRGVFLGRLTYAADTFEAQEIDFWPLLDYVGLLGIEPERIEPSPFQSLDLRWHFRRTLISARNAAHRWERPVLFVQIGPPALLPSSAAAAGRQEPAEEKARGLAALAEALELEALPHQQLAGLFLWCWSTDPDAGGRGSADASLQNGPAEDALAGLFEH